MTIQLLYFDGCPHVEATFDLIRRVASPQHASIRIEKIRVASRDDAVQRRFLGSPTVQIDGVDIEPAARNRADFGMSCRLYGNVGIPTADMIATAIREATE